METVYLTPKETASHLRVSNSYLKKLRRCGAGPKFYKRGRIIRYTLAAVDRWMEGVGSNKKGSKDAV
jgi:Helix-turn-helix domain